ncbi:MAG TPA: bifunctional acetate--CoA ligase family protein/GNAT family N-acetyltransferase [Burkholderiaceae bacterium]|nr:bifunctional acetate--CoA ligase family protein/GNAT family N-acetyltransferase [Burkholderiaceae bacterium]
MQDTHYLRSALAPRSVAVIGASERRGALGYDVFANLLAGGFKGRIDAVNPKYTCVQGRPCVPSLQALAEVPDLAITVTPARTLPGLVADAGARGVPNMLVLSPGFAEIGVEGRKLQDEMLRTARRHGVRLIGPNCLGLLRPSIGLNATFARTSARPGSVALVSQSGAVAAALLDHAWAAGFGFSSVVTTGDGSDVEFAELLDFLAMDPETRSVALYVEGVDNPRLFLSAVRAAASVKPVVVLKAGRHTIGSKAALSHTGALAGNDRVWDSALRRSGAIRVREYDQLFVASETLAGRRMPNGSRLAILTNGGGPGVLAADAVADKGAVLAGLSDAGRKALDGVLPATWSHANPVDVIGDADPQRLARAFEIVAQDPDNDGVLVLFCPTVRASAQEAARALLGPINGTRKPVVLAWLGAEDAARGRAVFKEAGLTSLASPEHGVEAFTFLAQHVRNRELRLQLPPPVDPAPAGSRPLDIAAARRIVDAVRKSGRNVLGEDEAKSVLAACGIEVAQGRLATSQAQARELAEQIGFPVVLKVRADGVTHKSEVGGVLLSLKTADEVGLGFELIRERVEKRAPHAHFTGVLVQKMISRPHGRELIVGIARDPSFGPVLTFGMGGIAVEVVSDSALALPPLNRVLASDLIDRTRVSRMLGPFRGMPAVDMDRLIDALIRVSELACELPCLRELDINPLLADGQGVVALDARVVVDERAIAPDAAYSHLAIHPYPKSLERPLHLADGTSLFLRPIRPEDAEAEQRFVARLSRQTLYMRMHAPVRELSVEQLIRFTQIDYDREMAFVAVDQEGGAGEIRAIARYTRLADGERAEFAVTVEDSWQGRGLGNAMMEALEQCGRDRRLGEIFGYVLKDNESMRQLMLARGYVAHREEDDAHVIRFGLPLRDKPVAQEVCAA